MNALTTQQPSPSNVSQELSALSTELAKMLGLVAPVTMSADQQTLWLASAVEALQGIRAAEVTKVSLEVRRLVTRPSQIVPEIARLVSEHRASQSRINRMEAEADEIRALPRPPKHIMDRDRSTFTPDDWAELSGYLASQGSTVRYREDGTKYTVEAA